MEKEGEMKKQSWLSWANDDDIAYGEKPRVAPSSFRSYTVPVDIVVRDERIGDMEVPAVGTEWLYCSTKVTVLTNPFWSWETRSVWVTVRSFRTGKTYGIAVHYLKPIPEEKTYEIRVKAKDEAEARERVKSGDVEVKEVDDD